MTRTFVPQLTPKALYYRSLRRTERRARAVLANPTDETRQLLREAARLTNEIALRWEV